MSRPWIKFFPTDWQSDVLVRSCSMAARGLWVELLCIMHSAEPRGALLVNGVKPNTALLSVLCGSSERDVAKLLAELEAAGVFSRTEDGTIFSRRMIRDEERAEADKANGKKGGNPKLKGGVNPPDKPTGNRRDNRWDKAHIPDARNLPNQEGVNTSDVELYAEELGSPPNVVRLGGRP